MSLHQTYRVNAPTVVSEAFEDEIVIIHLESGAYYSLDQSGAAIWQWLQQGVSLTEINHRLDRTYKMGADGIGRLVTPFLEELTQEQLIVPLVTTAQSANGLPSPTVGCESRADDVRTIHTPFTRPLLTKFTDMQDLLLLDPIHDVGAGGWPTKQ